MAKAQPEKTLATLLADRWEHLSRKTQQLADALPDEKFEWRPQPDIRTGGEVVRHLAFWNQYLSASLRNQKADDSSNELPLASYPTKARALGALQHSSADVVAAIREHSAALSPKTAELVMSFIEHTAEHYGQLVVYSRLLDVVPPASRS